MRRPALLAVAGLLALCAAPASAAEAATWRPDTRAARAFALQREGNVTFAVATARRGLVGYHGAVSVRSASVVKAMLMVAYLRRPDVRARPLRRAEQALRPR